MKIVIQSVFISNQVKFDDTVYEVFSVWISLYSIVT